LRRAAVFLSLLGGVLAALSFPKFGLSFLAWIALIPLFFALQGRRPKSAFGLGLAAGAAYYGILLYWIPGVPAHYGNVSKGLSFLIYIILIVFLGLYWGLFSSVYAAAGRAFPRVAWLLAPAIWTGSEFLLTRFLTGFPWGVLGTSQYKDLPLIQMAALTGVYGVSFVLILFQSSFVHSIRYGVRAPFLAGMIILSGLHLVGTLSMKDTPDGPDAIPAAVIQGNVSSAIDWAAMSDEKILGLLDRHLELSRRARRAGADLILWPEFTVPLCFSCPGRPYDSLSEGVRKFVAESGATLMLGSSETVGDPRNRVFFNTALCLGPDGSQTQYHKMHLVPFGEYTPYKKIFSFIKNMTHAIGDITPGRDYVLHRCKGIPFGTPVCYEIIFPDLVRRFARKGAAFLGTITNDGWYGKTSAPGQHFAQAVLRAVENRRFLLRAATTGISGIVDPYGRILARSELETRDVLSGRIVPSSRLTFYSRHGDVFALFCLTISCLSLILGVFGNRHERRHDRN
jgi:apolipoprotein N-acyltransferase